MSDTDAWANFIAQLDPIALERERMAVHGDLDAERPGSRQDHEMRFAHEYVRRDFWERMRGEVQSRTAALQRADADRAIKAQQDEEIEAAIRSYSERQAAKAAHERRTAA
jgi:hypothetical protein